jgi:thiol-disulfide isomerase/thioredoxin
MMAVVGLIVVLALGSPGARSAPGGSAADTRHSQSGASDAPGTRERGTERALTVGGDHEEPDATRYDEVATALDLFSATDLSGRQWTAADLRGRIVLLDFWATWCAPCLADLPLLKALREKHSRADFEIVGISLDVTSRRSFVSWLNRHRVTWPQVHERAGYSAGLPRLFGIEQLPSTVVVGRDGRPVAIDIRGDRLAALVDALVAERGSMGADDGGVR